MAKRELSNTLKNLKFMQRASNREEKTKKEEEVKPDDGNFLSPGSIKRKCMVIMEGDPHPGAIVGRMSFRSFNPVIDKLNEEHHHPEASATCSSNQTERNSSRENGSSQDGAECSKVDKVHSEANGDLKRKQPEAVSEPQYPNKSPKNNQVGEQSSPSNHKGKNKQAKNEKKMDWSVLRPPKFPNKKGGRKN